MRFIDKYQNWIFALAGLPAGFAFAFILNFYSGYSSSSIVTDGLVTTSFYCLSLWGMQLLINAYPTRVGGILYTLIAATLLGLLSTYFSTLLLKWWVHDEHVAYAVSIEATIAVRYTLGLLLHAGIGIWYVWRKQYRALELKFQQQSDASVMLREAELFKLRQQLQPHFLYNSLNSISALILVQPDKAQEMIGKLSDFLRSSVKKEAKDSIPLEDEIAYIEAYLAIEAIRFGDRLNVVINKDFPEHTYIPPFILQPILENAVKFGLYGKTGTVTITVTIFVKDGMLYIKVENPYDADTAPPRGTGFGLEGIRRRLYLLFARTDLVETQKEKDNFTTILKIPQLHV